MRLSLYQRLSFALLVVFVFITLLLIFGWQYLEKHTRIEAQQRLHLSLAANLARDNPLLQQGVYDHQALKKLFHTLMILGPAFEFYLIDPNGNIVTHSTDDSVLKRKKITLTPIKNLNENKQSLPVLGDDPKYRNKQNIFSAAPIFNGVELQGYLYIIVAGQKYQNTLAHVNAEKRGEITIMFIITALLFLFIVMLWLFSNITKPVKYLTDNMLAFQSSGFDFSVLNHKLFNLEQQDNEVAKLYQVFNEMAEKIDTQLTELNTINHKREEVLAEISHDLRTPLTITKGYIETLAIQGEVITQAERKHYIDTALKSVLQLNCLIEQVFELAHLTDSQSKLHLERFNISELLYDVVAKYKINAQALNVELSVTSPDHDLLLTTDVGKLERILSNLIDNALRHSAAGGSINLVVKKTITKQIIIEVIDTGTGIKEDELKNIFTARYRASNAKSTSNKQHSGLGLAIVKKLVNLLNAKISVESKLNQGTKFTITLNQ